MRRLAAFSVLLLGVLSATAVSASTFTIGYSGTVYRTYDYAAGQPDDNPDPQKVSAEIKFGGNSIEFSNGANQYALYDNIAWSFQVGSGPVYAGTYDFGGVYLHNETFPGAIGAEIFTGPGPAYAYIYLRWEPTTVPVTLPTFPSDEVAAALFFNAPLVSLGTFGGVTKMDQQIGYEFSIESFTAAYSPTATPTPLPGSAGLFISALGGIGWVAWRRRSSVARQHVTEA